MKKFFVFLCAMFAMSAFAHTMNWYVDGSMYDTTTCETGTNLAVPNPAPTKHGYHFVGWHFDEIIGTGSQSGTPTPTNPIEPTFKPFGNTVLRAVGSGDNIVADSYNPITNTITRRVGVEVMDGTEAFQNYSYGFIFYARGADVDSVARIIILCTHSNRGITSYVNGALYWATAYDDIGITQGDKTALRAWIADQYANGTPVTFYYKLIEPVEEQLP